MSFDSIGLVARNEFSNILRHPIVLVTIGLLSIMLVINAAGCPYLLEQFRLGDVKEVFLIGFGNTTSSSMVLLSFLSLCLGIVSVSGDRSDRSLSLLITKPLYRRDILAGKYIGVVAFLFIVICYVISLNVSLIMILWGGPERPEFYLNVLSFAFVAMIVCSLSTGLMFFTGVLFKDLKMALILSVSYTYLSWYIAHPLSLRPFTVALLSRQYLSVVSPPGGVSLISASTPFDVWLGAALPYIVLLLLETVAVFLINCYLFNKEDT